MLRLCAKVITRYEAESGFTSVTSDSKSVFSCHIALLSGTQGILGPGRTQKKSGPVFLIPSLSSNTFVFSFAFRS